MPAPLPSLAGSIVLKAVADLPARLYGGNAQTVAVTGLDYTLHLDIEKLPETETTSTRDQWTPVWDESRDVYERVNLNDVLLEVAAEQSASSSKVFDTKAAAEAATMPAVAKTLILTGYTTPGDACQQLTCMRVNAMPTDHEGWIRTVDRYTASGTVDSVNGGYWAYVIPVEGIRIEWFGGKADSILETIGTDNIVPYEKARRCVRNNVNLGFHVYVGGPTILFGFGLGGAVVSPPLYNYSHYYFSRTIKIDERTLTLRGAAKHGVVANGGWPTRFGFPPNVMGLFIEGYKGTGPATWSPGGHESVVENIAFFVIGDPALSTDPEADGFRINCTAVIRNCSFTHFGGHGGHVLATAGGAFPGAQASMWFTDCVYFDLNKRSGLCVQGADSNVGLALRCSMVGNGAWGIDSQSYLGSTYMNCHTRGNVLGPFRSTGSTSPDVFLGMYAEGDQPPAYCGPFVTVLGGLMYASGVDTRYGGTYQYGDVLQGGLKVYAPSANSTASTDNLILTLHKEPNVLWGWGGPSGEEFSWAYDATNDTYLMTYSHLGGADASYTITGGNNKLRMPANEILFPKGVRIGNDQRRINFGGAIPSDLGIYHVGDIQFYTFVGKGSHTGWVCILEGAIANAWVSGTDYSINLFRHSLPGTWVKNGAGKVYELLTDPGAVPSTVQPVHASGAVTGADGYRWGWIADGPPQWAVFGTFLEAASKNYDPPSIASMAVAPPVSVSMPGANVGTGDFAQASFSIPSGLIVNAWVSGYETVSVQFFNPTAAPIDLAAGIIYVRVAHQSALPSIPS